MNQDDPIYAERLPEMLATVSEQINKLKEKIAALSELVLQTEMQLLDLLPNSPEGKTSSAKEKPGTAKTRVSLDMLNGQNKNPLNQERDSILRAVQDVAKNAKTFTVHSI
jgi:hypothetical protein